MLWEDSPGRTAITLRHLESAKSGVGRFTSVISKIGGQRLTPPYFKGVLGQPGTKKEHSVNCEVCVRHHSVTRDQAEGTLATGKNS